jgi:hypothetical protein
MLVELGNDNENKVTYFFTLESRFAIVNNPVLQDEEGREIIPFHSKDYSYAVKTLKPQRIKRSKDPDEIPNAEERKVKLIIYDPTLPLVIKDLNLTDRKALIAFLNQYDLPDENKVIERDWYVGPWQNGRKVAALWRLEELQKRLMDVQKAVFLWSALMGGSGGCVEERELVKELSGSEERRLGVECELVQRISEALNRSPLPVRIHILPPGENTSYTKNLFRYELVPGGVFSYSWNVILKRLLQPPGKRFWPYKRCQKCHKWMYITRPYRITRRYCDTCSKEHMKEASRGRKRRERERKKTADGGQPRTHGPLPAISLRPQGRAQILRGSRVLNCQGYTFQLGDDIEPLWVRRGIGNDVGLGSNPESARPSPP